ncbi:hypothetical protein IQ238_25865 [Pleurocapsales cyanobacterium LEGE 06147]|nr:hypothetical protein [Pleurocapsales cyanobacterium LEGE 06147]
MFVLMCNYRVNIALKKCKTRGKHKLIRLSFQLLECIWAIAFISLLNTLLIVVYTRPLAKVLDVWDK